jgi:hypothetical protein
VLVIQKSQEVLSFAALELRRIPSHLELHPTSGGSATITVLNIKTEEQCPEPVIRPPYSPPKMSTDTQFDAAL